MKSIKGYKHIVNNKLKYFGMTDLKKKVITVNKKKSKKAGNGEVLDTIVHEHTHARHPKMSEKTVQKVTRTLLPSLSKKQKAGYYARYA